MQLPVLAVCDREEIYVYRMLEFLNFKKTFPFQMQAFTSALSLKEFVKKKRIEVLLVSEGLFEPYMEKYANYTILLSEKGNLQHDKTEKIEAMESIYKYQSVDMIMKQVLKICNREEPLKESILGEQGPKIIGIYSPVKRCLQTSFTILYGQILSKKHQVLYINFETYSGFASCYKGEKIPDLTDLMYFLNHSKEKFILKLAGMIQNVNGLDMVPPVLSFLDLASIPGEQWEILLGEIGKRCEYEYILLDLSDYIQGLFDILRLCTKVYTITGNDGMAIAKVEQYEKLLQALEYPDVMNKTVKCHFPQFQNIPSSIENLPYCEMASYIRQMIYEEINEKL